MEDYLSNRTQFTPHKDKIIKNEVTKWMSTTQYHCASKRSHVVQKETKGTRLVCVKNVPQLLEMPLGSTPILSLEETQELLSKCPICVYKLCPLIPHNSSESTPK